MYIQNLDTHSLTDDALDIVSGGLAISAATHPGRYDNGKLPPLPDSGLGSQTGNGMGTLVAGIIGMGIVLAL